ncbi:phosphatase PAP2 family protein [Oceanobacillus saliphilus]|uniref:phosphatase PAP2 family protein n=1 Tax=Oceanobacillus saliphilus TaxID=2925834 RepID=UPI00201E0BCF|nr:phosphatase PAP2 family protein [Oceanobacillus saliphilus]
MGKLFAHFYTVECQLFKYVNQYFSQRHLNLFFRSITHLGGARLTIATILLIILFTSDAVRLTAVASAIALAISHIPVMIAKKLFPRKRPYLALPQINVTNNPLRDHSFPSGHTTAIFSVIIPFILFYPTLTIVLLPVAFAVGISRIYLGLHYPSDVMAGCLLGSLTGTLSYVFVAANFPLNFL